MQSVIDSLMSITQVTLSTYHHEFHSSIQVMLKYRCVQVYDGREPLNVFITQYLI